MNPMADAQPHILFAWEMGANYGHANKVTQVAEALAGKAKLTIAARDPVAIRSLSPDLPATLLPAPYNSRSPHKGEAFGQSFPGLLQTEGWDDANKLGPLVESWRSVYELTKPDILVAQAAPTALLAARDLGFRKAILGSGWDTPARADPMPCFSPEDPGSVRLAHEQEAKVFAIANEVLRTFGSAPLPAFRDLYDVDQTLLVAMAETDHMAPRDAIEPDHPPYLGQLITDQSGQELSWIKQDVPRILAYLRPTNPQYIEIARGLARIGASCDIILAVPGVNPTQAQQLTDKGIRVVDGPVRLDRLLPDCDLGVSHGTNGIGSAFITYGVPQIGIPTHHEQMLFTKAVARAGLGLGIAGDFKADQVVEAIQRALGSKTMKEKTVEVKKSIVARDLHRPAERAAEMLLGL